VGTLRDDIVRAGRRLLEVVEDKTGREVVSSEELRLLESDRDELRKARKTLEFIGFRLFNYDAPSALGATPASDDLRPLVRKFSYRQALTAWVDDPIVGQSVELYLSFVFGRGVPRPQAHDPEVQAHLDRTWDDPANRRVLTSFDKLLEKGVDLCLQSNVFFKLFDDGEDGMARISLERFEDVEDVIRHSELTPNGDGDRFRILYYRVRQQRVRYDFSSGERREVVGGNDPGDTARTVYYEAWGAFDDADPVQAAQDDGLQRPPASMIGRGKILHLAVNKTSEMAFGVPRIRRIINWATAYNEMLVSFRDRMKAMASVYLKMTARGSQRDLDRLAMLATGRASAFGGSLESGGGTVATPPAAGPGILQENEAVRHEPFKIDSTAGDVAAAAPVIRSQMTGPWPDSYLSGFAEGALAGAQSLELPTLKFVEREQELWATKVFRPFAEASIRAAVKAGDISEWRDPTEEEVRRIEEARAVGEPMPFEVNEAGQVKRDLSFDLALPSPLKRAMLDVVSAAVQTAAAVDPQGTNPELSRWLFAHVLREAFDEEHPMRIVDQVLPRRFMAPDPDPRDVDGDGLPDEGMVGPDGQRHSQENPGGAPVRSPQPEERPVNESAASEAAARLVESVMRGGGDPE